VLVHDGPLGGGATAAGMGHLIALDDQGPSAQLTDRSLAQWHAAELPDDCEYVRCGCLWVAADGEEMAEARAKAERYRGRGIAAEVVGPDDLGRLEPELSPGLAGGLLVPSDAAIYAPRAAAWLWRRARLAGARRQTGRVARVEPRTARLEDGSVLEGDWIVVAAGDRSPGLLPGLPIRPRKGHLVITQRHPGFVRHQVIELGYVKSAHGRGLESVACNIQPRCTGQVLIGSSRQLDRDDPVAEPAILRRMLERATVFFPRLAELTAIRVWTGLRATTPDGVPIVGVLEDGLAVATGHEGLGITQAPGTARLLRHCLFADAPDLDPEPYRPQRFGEVAA